MTALIDLPTRRNEAWRYSDLRAAVGGAVPSPAQRERSSPEVGRAMHEAGVIGALAAQTGAVTELVVPNGESIVRVDRPRGGNLSPTLLRAHVAPGGRLARVVVQAETSDIVLDAAYVRLETGAKFHQIVIAEGGKLARIETHVAVDGERAEVELNGVYLCGASRHADLTSVITHAAPSSETRQLIKGAARKGGRGVFQGKIVVERAAQKTDARQHHKGLLLEEGAEIFAKPELMIYADDVVCAHGNTAGGVDDSALFYLRSRGIPEREARALLLEAFLTEVIPDWLDSELRSEIEQRIGVWLRSAR